MPLDPALQKELLALYDGYKKAILSGNFQKALSYHDKKTQKEIQSEMNSEEKRREYFEWTEQFLPDTLEVIYGRLSKDGKRVVIYSNAKKTIPPEMRGKEGVPKDVVALYELQLEFIKEDGKWKYVGQTFISDLRKISRCTNTVFEPPDAYIIGKASFISGHIVHVEFAENYTKIMLKVLDEELCLFMPPQKELEKGGLDTKLLKEWNTVEAEVFPHKTDKLKGLINNITVTEEE